MSAEVLTMTGGLIQSEQRENKIKLNKYTVH